MEVAFDQIICGRRSLALIRTIFSLLSSTDRQIRVQHYAAHGFFGDANVSSE